MSIIDIIERIIEPLYSDRFLPSMMFFCSVTVAAVVVLPLLQTLLAGVKSKIAGLLVPFSFLIIGALCCIDFRKYIDTITFEGWRNYLNSVILTVIVMFVAMSEVFLRIYLIRKNKPHLPVIPWDIIGASVYILNGVFLKPFFEVLFILLAAFVLLALRSRTNCHKAFWIIIYVAQIVSSFEIIYMTLYSCLYAKNSVSEILPIVSLSCSMAILFMLTTVSFLAGRLDKKEKLTYESNRQ